MWRPADLLSTRELVLASLGLAIGLCLAMAVTRLVGRYLVGVSSLDVVTFWSMAGLLAALAATCIPARRAAAIDPVRALKME